MVSHCINLGYRCLNQYFQRTEVNLKLPNLALVLRQSDLRKLCRPRSDVTFRSGSKLFAMLSAIFDTLADSKIDLFIFLGKYSKKLRSQKY